MLEIINDSNHAQQCQILIKEGHKVPRKKVKQAQKSHEEVHGGVGGGGAGESFPHKQDGSF